MKTFKYILTILAILACCFVFYKCNEKKITPAQTKRLIEQDKQQIADIKAAKEDTTVQLDNGHSERTASVGDVKQIEIFYKHKLDSVAKLLNIKTKQIDNVTDLKATMTSSSESDAFGDMFGESNSDNGILEFKIKDTCINGYAIVDVNTRNLKRYEEINIPIHGTLYWKRKHHIWFINWGRPIYKQDFSSDCPNVKIKEIQSIKIVKHKF